MTQGWFCYTWRLKAACFIPAYKNGEIVCTEGSESEGRGKHRWLHEEAGEPVPAKQCEGCVGSMKMIMDFRDRESWAEGTLNRVNVLQQVQPRTPDLPAKHTWHPLCDQSQLDTLPTPRNHKRGQVSSGVEGEGVLRVDYFLFLWDPPPGLFLLGDSAMYIGGETALQCFRFKLSCCASCTKC